MENKLNLSQKVSGAGKSAVGFLDKAKKKVVNAVDQNDDGKLNLQDVSVIADEVGSVARKAAINVKESAEESARQRELKTLCPLFVGDLENADFAMHKFIHLTEMDKKHLQSEVCKGSVGYSSFQKDLHIIHIYRDKVEQFGLTFYPDSASEFYFVDPCDRDHYIALESYFNYMKTARINELQTVAKDLGAKYFKISYLEENKEYSQKKANGKANGGMAGGKAGTPVEASVEGDHSISADHYAKIEVAVEMECPGHEPSAPELKYLLRDTSVQALIHMRMDEKAPATHHTVTLQLSNTSGIHENDALKIDTILKGMKYSGNINMASEVQKEFSRHLMYDIYF